MATRGAAAPGPVAQPGHGSEELHNQIALLEISHCLGLSQGPAPARVIPGGRQKITNSFVWCSHMDNILEILNQSLFTRKNDTDTKNCAIFQTPHHPARVIAAPPLVLKVRELQFRPRAEWRPETGSGETQRD